MDIGSSLKNIRLEHNMRQKDIAKKLQINENTYSQYENDKRLPNIEILWKMADIYNISIDILIGRYKK